MNDMEKRIVAIEKHNARHRYLNMLLICIFAGIILFEIITAKSTNAQSYEFRIHYAVFVTMAMFGAICISLLIRFKISMDWMGSEGIMHFVSAGIFVIGLVGATVIFLYENTNIAVWLAGRLVFIMAGVLIGFTWGNARQLRFPSLSRKNGEPEDK